MKQLRYLLEFILLYPVLAAVKVLPVRLATGFVTALADAYYFLDASRRKIARENIMQSGICAEEGEAATVARKSYRHFALLVLESLKSSRILDAPDWRDHVEMHIPPEIEKFLEDPKQGIILATGHFGSWELAAQLISRMKPVAGVTRSMNNPYVDRLIQKRKPRYRFHMVPKIDPDNINRFTQILKNGEILALMIDQHGGKRGMQVDFFSRPASTHTAIALLHLVTRAPLCFGYCRRVGESFYELTAVGPFRHEPTGDKERDIRRILETLNLELEKAVRSSPEQYLWGHRRWRES